MCPKAFIGRPKIVCFLTIQKILLFVLDLVKHKNGTTYADGCLKHILKNLSENDGLDSAHHVPHKISISGSGVVTIYPSIFILILRGEFFLDEPAENEILNIVRPFEILLTLHDSLCPRHFLHPLDRCTLCMLPSVELPSIFL